MDTEASKPAFDSILDSGEWVVNLFIEGESLEIVAEEDAPVEENPTLSQDRPSNWRTNLADARAVAKSLGIETKGKKLERLLGEIDAKPLDDINLALKPLLTKLDELHAASGDRDYRSIIGQNTTDGAYIAFEYRTGDSHAYKVVSSEYNATDHTINLGIVKVPFAKANVRNKESSNVEVKTLSVADFTQLDSLFLSQSDWLVSRLIVLGVLPKNSSQNNGAEAVADSAPAMPTQEDQDREFLQSAIDEKINILDAANVNKLAELSKVYTQGDMNGLIKQAKQVAIDAVKRSVANATAKMN